MNEPKRRGRPPKAKVEEYARPTEPGDVWEASKGPWVVTHRLTEPVINGDHSREPEDALSKKVVEAMGRIPREDTPFVQARLAEKQIELSRRQAQNYALRVWNGQSRDVPRNERLKRVKAALEGQGLSMEGVEL